MAVSLPQLEELPRRNATEAKNRWGGLVREVRTLGTIAITSHDKVEVVILEAGKYREMAALVYDAEKRRKTALDELSAEFDQHLASLKTPDARARVDAVMAAKGRAKVRSKAGASF
jgi:prevent-host-death family protein